MQESQIRDDFVLYCTCISLFLLVDKDDFTQSTIVIYIAVWTLLFAKIWPTKINQPQSRWAIWLILDRPP